jgi:hypothetical protein
MYLRMEQWGQKLFNVLIHNEVRFCKIKMKVKVISLWIISLHTTIYIQFQSRI